MARKLKVYRTPIGFHDAYVAAPSQKAALKAWGTDANLFARGAAELVTDAALVREPLDRPGEVIRRLRGTDAEHIAALPKDPPPRKKPSASERDEDDGPPRRRDRPPARRSEAGAPVERPRKSTPKPSRTKLDEAEQALDRVRANHADAIADLRQREKQLQLERRATEARQEEESSRLQAAVDEARARYGDALEKWRH